MEMRGQNQMVLKGQDQVVLKGQDHGLERQGQDLDLQGQVLGLLGWGRVGCGVGREVWEEGKEFVHGLH